MGKRIFNFCLALISRCILSARSGLVSFLAFVRIVDAHDGGVSLTNCALIVCIVKLAILKTFDLPDLAALMGVLMSYAHKRSARAKVKDHSDRLGALEQAVQVVKDVADKASAGLQATSDRLAMVDNRTKGR